MTLRLLTEHHLVFLSLKRGCIGLSASTLVKKPHCWKLYVAAHMVLYHSKILDSVIKGHKQQGHNFLEVLNLRVTILANIVLGLSKLL